MKQSSRTKNSFINSSVGSVTQIVNNLINFGIRTLFIYYLSTEYLGLNGLFSNILNILNFAELGFGNAIIYNMYKPVAEDDKERIKSLVKLYKLIYRMIGLLILILGLLVVPFMGYIIKDAPTVKENLNIIYILYLLQTVGTYFYGYKRAILIAYQKDYMNSVVDFIFNIIKAVIQIFILIFTQNYILYLLTYIVTTILSNIAISLKADKEYPFLKEKNVEKIEKKELTQIFENVKALIIYKFGSTIQNGTDNILLTMLVSLTAVGLYSNYNTVISAISGILWTVLTGMTGSIGNMNAKESDERKEKILLQVNFISSYLYGIAFICLAVLLNPFVTIWIGKEYIFSIETVITISACIYLKGFEFPMITYRNTLGIFKEGKKAPLISAIINIGLSIILGKLYGVLGIFLATIIAMCTTTIWYNPYILYKKRLNKSPKLYYLNSIYYIVAIIITFVICYKINSLMNLSGILGFIIQAIVTFILSNILLIIFVCRKQEFKEVKEKIIGLVKSRR